jgi:hypothetical protein
MFTEFLVGNLVGNIHMEDWEESGKITLRKN